MLYVNYLLKPKNKYQNILTDKNKLIPLHCD